MEENTYNKLYRGKPRTCWKCASFYWGIGLSSCGLGYTPDQAHRPDDCPIKPHSTRGMCLLKRKA